MSSTNTDSTIVTNSPFYINYSLDLPSYFVFRYDIYVIVAILVIIRIYFRYRPNRIPLLTRIRNYFRPPQEVVTIESPTNPPALVVPYTNSLYPPCPVYQAHGLPPTGPVNGQTSSIIEAESLGDNLSNQLLPPEPSNQLVTSLQTQVAPKITELTTLSTDKVTPIYSTPMFLGDFAFLATSVAGDSVASVNVTNIMANANVKRLFTDHRYAAFDVRITMNVTGNPFASGLLVAASRPLTPLIPGSPAASDPTLNQPNPYNFLQQALALNHTLIDVSVDGVYTIDIPYTHFQSMIFSLDSLTTPSWAIFSVTCLSPMLPATGGTTQVNFELYATMINIKTIETMSYVAQGLFSSVTNTYNINAARDASLPSNITGDTLSATATVPYGLDNPSDTSNPAPKQNTLFQKICSTLSVLNVFRASQRPDHLSTFPQEVMNDLRLQIDEMDFAFFRNRFTYVGSFSATLATANNSIIFSMPILANPLKPGAQATTFQELTSFYMYWRGSIKFRLCIASNAYKRGKLLAAIHYGMPPSLVTSIVTGAIDPRSVPHIIIDVSNTDRFVDIEVPYKSIYEYLRTCSVNQVLTAQPLNEFSLGTLAVYLVSPITTSNGTPGTVNVSVLHAWGDDFSLYTDFNRRLNYAQSKLFPPDSSPTPNTRSADLAPCLSLKEILLKPLFAGNYTCPPTAGATTTPLIIPISPNLWATSAEWSFMLASYQGLRGSLRVVVRYVPTNANTAYLPLRITHVPYLSFKGTAPPFAQFSDAQEFGLNSAVYPYTDTNLNRVQLNSSSIIPAGASASVTFTNIGGVTEHLLSPDQPEVIIELPDPSPLYRSQPTSLVPIGYNFNPAKYTPFNDRNVPCLIIQPVDSSPVSPTNILFSVSILAGDDLRFFWYSGGPTHYNSNTYVYTLAGTSTTYPAIISNV